MKWSINYLSEEKFSKILRQTKKIFSQKKRQKMYEMVFYSQAYVLNSISNVHLVKQ